MRISFNDDQYDDLIEVLDRMVDACTDHDVELFGRVRGHLERAKSYSRAGSSKIRYLRDSADKKRREADSIAFRDGIKAYSKK